MLSECANPQCRAGFDYHEGEFFRFRMPVPNDGQPANMHSVRHLWLCGHCAKVYYLEQVQNRGILLRPRTGAFDSATPGLFICAA
jgi:hypothetical protein